MDQALAVGFIGLGNQGSPIARRIVNAGFPLTIWARRPNSLDSFADTSAKVAASAAALAGACQVIGICVVNDDDVRQVLLEQGVLEAARPGTVIAIHSTLLPQTVIELDRLAQARGVHLLDAPVSGGNRGAELGTMAIMVGGDMAALDRARPVFETFSAKIAHLGAVGCGQMMKLLNNNLAYANLVMGINALELAAELGMDRAVTADVIRASSGNSGGFGILTNPETLTKITGPTSNLAKDVHHLAEVAAAHGRGDAPLVAIAQSAAARLASYTTR